MSRPASSQAPNRNQVTLGGLYMRYKQKPTVVSGVKGTPGVLNFLSTSGRVFLKTTTPMETRTKANRVPMLQRSMIIDNGKRPAIAAVTIPVTQVQMWGVLWTGWTRENEAGRRPARATTM